MATVTVATDTIEHNGHHGAIFHIEDNNSGVDLLVFLPLDGNDILDALRVVQAIGSDITNILMKGLEAENDG